MTASLPHLAWSLALLTSACSATAPDPAARTEDVMFTSRVQLLPVPESPLGSGMPAGASLHYYGGAVIERPRVVQVLWGSGTYIPELTATAGATMSGAYRQMVESGVLDWLSEYDAGPARAIGRGSFAASVEITPSTGKTITNAHVQRELAAQIAASLLPPPTSDHVYLVSFPAGVTIIAPDGTQSCVAGGFCAYHGTFRIGARSVPYAVLPALTGACDACAAGTPYERQQVVSSHALVAMITDPELGLATVVGSPLGWYDAAHGEAPDLCRGQQTTFTGLDGKAYAIRPGFANSAGACTALRGPQPGQAKQSAVWRTADNHVDWLRNDGLGWVHNEDVTALFEGALPAADPIGITVETREHVAFLGTDGHVHEVMLDGTRSLGHADLSALLGGALPAGMLFAYAQGPLRHILFRSADDHLRELYHDGRDWLANNDLTRHLGGDGPAGNPGAYVRGDHQRIVFRSADNHLHELFNDGTQWVSNTDLTLLVGGDGPAGDPAGYYLRETQHVVYRSANGNLHEVFGDGTRWIANNDMTVLVGGHAPAGDPSGYTMGATSHIIFRCVENHVHELYNGGVFWANNNLTTFLRGAEAASDPVGYSVGDTQHILFRGTDGHAHEFYNDGTRWFDHDLTRFVGGSGPAGAVAAWAR